MKRVRAVRRWSAGARIAVPGLALLAARDCKRALRRRLVRASRSAPTLDGDGVTLRAVALGDVRTWAESDRSAWFDAAVPVAGETPRTVLGWARRSRRLRALARGGDFHPFTIVRSGDPVGEVVVRYDQGSATAELWLWTIAEPDQYSFAAVLARVEEYLVGIHPDIRRVVFAAAQGSSVRETLRRNGFEQEGSAAPRITDACRRGRELWVKLVA